MPVPFHTELLYALGTLARQVNPGDTWITFSKLLWPIVFVQGGTSNHIVVDDLDFSRLQLKITNPPRTARVGQVLRDPAFHNLERLEKIVEILTYADDLEERPPDEAEKAEQTIPGLFTPALIEAIQSQIPGAQVQPIGASSVLDSAFTTDQVLNLSEQYRKLVETTEGNEYRWRTVEQLIREPYERWIGNLKVKLKDAKARFDSDLTKTDKIINEEWIQGRINAEKDQLEIWTLRQKKDIMKKFVNLLRPIDRIMWEIHQSNREILSADALLTLQEGEVVETTKSQLDRIETVLPNVSRLLEEAKQEYTETLSELKVVEEKAATRLEQVQNEMAQQLRNKEMSIEEIKRQQADALKEIEREMEGLTKNYREILDIIERYARECRKEHQELAHWVLPDSVSEFTQPVIRMFIPLYAAVVEDEDFEEHIHLLFPSQASQTGESVELTVVAREFENFQQRVQEALEDDIRKRSNLEFACEEKNLLVMGEVTKEFERGVRLAKKKLPAEYVSNLEELWSQLRQE